VNNQTFNEINWWHT